MLKAAFGIMKKEKGKIGINRTSIIKNLIYELYFNRYLQENNNTHVEFISLRLQTETYRYFLL